MLDSFPHQFIREGNSGDSVPACDTAFVQGRTKPNFASHTGNSLWTISEWLQVASLLREKLGTRLGSLAKWIENNGTLHFLLNHNTLKFVLHSFIWFFCLRLIVLCWNSDWKQEVRSVKVLSYNSRVLLFTTNTLLPFHEAMDANLPSGVGPKSKCKFRP